MTEPAKKHPCPDCRYCQWCSEDRCRLCLKTGCGRKLSLAEQVSLFEQLNRGKPEDSADKAVETAPPPQK